MSEEACIHAGDVHTEGSYFLVRLGQPEKTGSI